jgi:type VI secretion system protein ImpJ
MLLAPQHFQQMSLRYDALLHYHTMMVAPFSWGVIRLKYDPVLLVNGTFRILELEARMPDGLVVHHATEDGDLDVDLTEFADAMKQRPHTVHLVVPAHRVTTAVNGELPRYDSVTGEPIVDINTGEGELYIPRLRPRLSLVVADNPPSKFVSFPLARVIFERDMYVLTDFIAPLLSVQQQDPLGDICAQIARRLREKARYLFDEVRTRYFELGSSGVLENNAKIQSLVEPLPMLEASLYTGVSHPYLLYLSLCMVVGHVAALDSKSMIPPVLPPYDHNDLRLTFARVKDYIFKTIEEGIWESHFVIPFTLQNNVFSLLMEEAWMKGTSLMIGVGGAESATEREVQAWVQGALIGSESKMQSLRERRILGAARESMTDENTLVAARELMLFSIDMERDYIVDGEQLQILNLNGKGNPVAKIVLLVPKERNR